MYRLVSNPRWDKSLAERQAMADQNMAPTPDRPQVHVEFVPEEAEVPHDNAA